MRSHRNIPFGYMMRGGEILLHPEESVAVREIFDMYLRGMSLKSIAASMTVPYNVDKVWNKNMVSRILENERYTGSDGYLAVIEPEMFRKANEIKKHTNRDCSRNFQHTMIQKQKKSQKVQPIRNAGCLTALENQKDFIT